MLHSSSLPDEGILQGPLVLQVVRAVNVSAPLERQSSGGAPRMLKLTLSDGSTTTQALEVQAASQLPNAMPTGTKLHFPHAIIPVSAWVRTRLDSSAGQKGDGVRLGGTRMNEVVVEECWVGT